MNFHPITPRVERAPSGDDRAPSRYDRPRKRSRVRRDSGLLAFFNALFAVLAIFSV